MISSLAVAFLGGLVSFLAPCVLPLIPGMLAYLGGTTLNDENYNRRPVFINSVFFVLGFGLVFSLLGVLLNTLLEAVAYDAQIWLARIGGIIIIFFGLYLTGLFRLSFLEKERKVKVNTASRSRYVGSFLFGVAFAAGWTPCVGPALGAILGLAATQPGSAYLLLLAYSAGLAIPFLLVGLFAPEFKRFIIGKGKVIQIVNVIFGLLLVIFGILMFTQTLARLANLEFITNVLR